LGFVVFSEEREAKAMGDERLNLLQYKALFLVVTGVVVLFIASPVLEKVLVYPQTEYFTELWLLGPQHTAENYPHNITRGEDSSIFLGIANHLGSCAYYVVEVKFRNATQSGPDSFNRTCSSLEPLYSLNVFVPDKETLEMPMSFSLDYSFDEVTRTAYRNVPVSTHDGNVTYRTISENVTLERANLNHLRLNDVTVSLQGLSSDFNPQTREFFGNLVFELWLYNPQTSNLVYHERYVDLKLNLTKT
jgi:hypothetical protein